MNNVFVIRNQLGQFWGKKKHWVDGRKRRKILTFKHKDEGLNQLVELSARDVSLRGEVVAVEHNDRGLPLVTASEHLIADEEDLLEEQAAADEAAGEPGESGDQEEETAAQT
jgi:hypothetical protein